MLSERLRQELRPVAQLMTIFWFAELASCLLYGLVAWLVADTPGPVLAPGLLRTLVILLSAVAGTALLAGLFVSRFLVFSRARFRPDLGPDAAAFSVAGLTPMENAVLHFIRGRIRPYLLGLGLVNCCPVCGMVLAILGRDPQLFLPFFLAGIVAFPLAPPRTIAFAEELL